MKLDARKLGRRVLWAGLVLFLLGGSFEIANYSWYRTRTWRVVNVPVTLAEGQVDSQEFRVNINENFVILLEVDRQIPIEIAENVLGIQDPGSERRSEPHGFKLKWIVFEDGKVLKSGVSDGSGEGYWSRKEGRALGFFPGKEAIDIEL